MNQTSSPGKLIPFKVPASHSSGSPVDLSAALSVNVEQRLRSIVEGAVMDAYVRMQLGFLQPVDTPFGPLFIERLEADSIASATLSVIMSAATTEDISETITLSDDLD